MRKTTLAVLAAIPFLVYAAATAKGMYRIRNRVAHAGRAFLVSALEGKDVRRLNVPFHAQRAKLSCEIASLEMVLDYYGKDVAETELVSRLAIDTIAPRSADNVWGDPDKGFVGDVNGVPPNTGYGVYEGPIAELAKNYRPAEALEHSTLAHILRHVSEGRPVIVWGVVGAGKDISWKTRDGKQVHAVAGEHARIVVGYTGALDDPRYILMIDPIYDRVVMSKDEFVRNWAILGNKAVIVY